MSFLLLFQNLLHELENRSSFHQRRIFTSGLLLWTLKKLQSIYCSAAAAEFPARVASQEESFLPNRQMRDPSTDPLFQPRRLLSACSTAGRLCLQDVPGLTNQCSLCLSPGQPCVRAPAASLGQVAPTPLLCSGRAWLPPLLTAWCKTISITRTVLWSVGGWFSLVFLGVGFLSFPLICHVIHC